MMEVERMNLLDVVCAAVSQAFLQSTIRLFQLDSDMKSTVLTDAEACKQAIWHFLDRALRQVRELKE